MGVTRRLAARVGPLVPARLEARLRAARSWVAAGVAVGPPRARRVLALAPHPDDESVGYGGTLALAAASGARVVLAFASDGDATLGSAATSAEIAAARREEGRQAAALLGVTDVRCLAHPDGALGRHLAALTTDVRRLLDEVSPDLVLAPWFLDGTDDHQAVALALARAGPGADVEVWGAEIWTPVAGNRLVDVTAVIEQKRAAIAAHATAHGAFDVGATLGLSRYRSVHGLRGRGYGELFLALPGDRYRELVERELHHDGTHVRARTP